MINFKLTNDFPSISCIYKIINLKNKCEYIGLTKNLKRRINAHKHCLDRNIHYNRLLQKDFNIFGIQSFQIKFFYEKESIHKLKILEKKIIKNISKNLLYNNSNKRLKNQQFLPSWYPDFVSPFFKLIKKFHICPNCNSKIYCDK